MYRYRMYGLGVQSDVPFWGESVEECPVDVTVSWRSYQTPIPDAAAPREVATQEGDGRISVAWPGIARMTIRDGRSIDIETVGEDELNYARHLIAGLGLGLILHQRGVFTLHASTVAIGSQAIALAGAKRAGKSTIAAALAAAGHTLLSDDVLALDMPDTGLPRVLPGPTTINLWPDAAEVLGHDLGALPKIWPRSSKRVSSLSAERRPVVPLSHIFFLEVVPEDDEPAIEELEPSEGMPLLIGHSHALRYVQEAGATPEHLFQCGRVAEGVALRRLRRPRGLHSIQGVIRLIEEHLLASTKEPLTTRGF